MNSAINIASVLITGTKTVKGTVEAIGWLWGGIKYIRGKIRKQKKEIEEIDTKDDWTLLITREQLS